MADITHWRRSWMLALFGAVMFTAIAAAVLADVSIGVDRWLIERIQGRESPALTTLAEALSFLGSTTTVIVLAVGIVVFLWAVLGHRKELLLFIVVLGGSALLNRILKAVFQRERPDIYRLAEETGYSFPSGHSMAAFALYGALAYLLWAHTASNKGRTALVAVCLLLTLGIGLSRIYLGVHYPSDILGGYFASGVWLALTVGIYRRTLRN